MVDLHDIEILLLDLPARELDAGHVSQGDTDLTLLADEPDAGLHDRDHALLPVGILDEHSATDRRGHKESVQPVGATLGDDELFENRENLLHRRDPVDLRRIRAGDDRYLVLLCFEIDHGSVGDLTLKRSTDMDTVLTDAHRRRNPLPPMLNLYRNRFHHRHHDPSRIITTQSL